MKKCFYAVLEITKPSNEDEIRKAYKKLALKWHPDKNPDNPKVAEERFKEIGEAYAVLSSKEKKVLYDQYGHEGVMSGGERTPGGHFNTRNYQGFSYKAADDVFKNFFTSFFDEDDEFFTGFFKQKSPTRGAKGRADPTASPFGSFGRFGAFNHFDFDDHGDDVFSQSSMFKGGFGSTGGGGFSKSTSTSTVTKNGKTVTVTKVTTTQPDGTRTTEIKETMVEGGRKVERNYIEDGRGNRTEVKRLGS